MTPYATVGNATLYCGDVIEVLRQVAERPNVAVLSPPYNLDKDYGITDARAYPNYILWSHEWLTELAITMAPQARLCLNVPLDTNLGGPRPVFADLVTAAQRSGWTYRHSIVWNEQNISRRTAWGSWRQATAPNVISPVEMIAVFHTGLWRRTAQTSTIGADDFKTWTLGHWAFPGESAKRVGHPAPFPEELPRRLIQLYSFAEDTIVDPFAGVCTTGVVAAELGRRSIMIDQSEEYLRKGEARILARLAATISSVAYSPDCDKRGVTANV